LDSPAIALPQNRSAVKHTTLESKSINLSWQTAVGGLNEGSTMQYQGLGGLIVLVADIWAIVNIFQSSADTGKKVLWTVLVIILPVLGFILWLFLGPRTGKA
jgi:hypothetical protein